jgi:hypothetical protein
VAHWASSGGMGSESVVVYTDCVLVSVRPISTRLESLEKESGMGTERSRQPPARRDLSSCSPPSGAGAHRRGGCRRAAGFSITSRRWLRHGRGYGHTLVELTSNRIIVEVSGTRQRPLLSRTVRRHTDLQRPAAVMFDRAGRPACYSLWLSRRRLPSSTKVCARPHRCLTRFF